MSALAGRLKKLWTKANEYADALEGASASLDDYVFALMDFRRGFDSLISTVVGVRIKRRLALFAFVSCMRKICMIFELRLSSIRRLHFPQKASKCLDISENDVELIWCWRSGRDAMRHGI